MVLPLRTVRSSIAGPLVVDYIEVGEPTLPRSRVPVHFQDGIPAPPKLSSFTVTARHIHANVPSGVNVKKYPQQLKVSLLK